MESLERREVNQELNNRRYRVSELHNQLASMSVVHGLRIRVANADDEVGVKAGAGDGEGACEDAAGADVAEA